MPTALLPHDRYDQALLSNVHPDAWSNPTPADRYDLVVLGAGTAGLVSAAGAAGVGARVALVERGLLGGDCLNSGCVPSKTLLRSAAALEGVRRADRFGIRGAAEPQIDFPAVMERVREVRARTSDDDAASRFRDDLGVDLFLGSGAFVDARRVEVDGAQLHFRKAVVATGARPVVPDVPGLAQAHPLTNENVFALTELPRRMAVLGGGPIGCELAQAFARFGTQVTLIERSDQFLEREDPVASEILAHRMKEEGVSIRLETELSRVETRGDEKHLRLEAGENTSDLVVDEILVAVGRRPNVEGLGLERAGIDWGPQGITVNDRLRTTNRHVFAAGDVCMEAKFTHAADFAARTVIQNALFFGRKKLSALTIPWCTYTDPEIAHVGIDETQAREKGIAIETFERPLSEVDRARTDGEQAGFIKIFVRRGSDRIQGAVIVAPHAGDMIGEISLAMTQGIGLTRLASVIHPYPTYAEAIRQCGDAYRRTRLTPRVKRWMEGFLALLR